MISQDLHVKFADFQDNCIVESSELVAGWSGVPCRYFWPRENEFEANSKTERIRNIEKCKVDGSS